MSRRRIPDAATDPRTRVSVKVDDELHAAAKLMATDSGQTLSAVIETALRKDLDRRRLPKKPVKLLTATGTGLMPGVDIDNSAALLDIVDPPEEIAAKLARQAGEWGDRA